MNFECKRKYREINEKLRKFILKRDGIYYLSNLDKAYMELFFELDKLLNFTSKPFNVDCFNKFEKIENDIRKKYKNIYDNYKIKIESLCYNFSKKYEIKFCDLNKNEVNLYALFELFKDYKQINLENKNKEISLYFDLLNDIEMESLSFESEEEIQNYAAILGIDWAKFTKLLSEIELGFINDKLKFSNRKIWSSSTSCSLGQKTETIDYYKDVIDYIPDSKIKFEYEDFKPNKRSILIIDNKIMQEVYLDDKGIVVEYSKDFFELKGCFKPLIIQKFTINKESLEIHYYKSCSPNENDAVSSNTIKELYRMDSFS